MEGGIVISILMPMSLWMSFHVMSCHVMSCHIHSNANASNSVTAIVNVDASVNASMNVRIAKCSTNSNAAELLFACAQTA